MNVVRCICGEIVECPQEENSCKNCARLWNKNGNWIGDPPPERAPYSKDDEIRAAEQAAADQREREVRDVAEAEHEKWVRETKCYVTTEAEILKPDVLNDEPPALAKVLPQRPKRKRSKKKS